MSFAGSWLWPHPLITERSIVRALDQRTLLGTKGCLECQKWKMKEAFSHPFMQESRTMAHLALTRAFLRPAATATMHCHPLGDAHPPPLVPSSLLVQSLPSKQIALTDNMWPNSSAVVKRLNYKGTSLRVSLSDHLYKHIAFVLIWLVQMGWSRKVYLESKILINTPLGTPSGRAHLSVADLMPTLHGLKPIGRSE